MDLSVIIVCFKGYERLDRCLRSLDSFSQRDLDMEVILVNNNPGDKEFENVAKAYPGFRIVHNTVNGGYSNGCNLGCSMAAGDYFLVLNPDTVASGEAIRSLLDAARSNPSFHLLSCRQVNENGKESRAYGKFPWERSFSGKSDHAGILYPDWVSGSVMMMNRDIFKKLGGFDEDFWMYYEDVDLCRRIRNSGGEIAFYQNITVEHNHGASSRTDARTAAISKCEVQISRHLHIQKHTKGLRRVAIHSAVVADNLVTGLISGAAGLVLFFIPRLFVRFLLLLRLASYYYGSLTKRTWLSTRSVNFRKINCPASS